MSMVSPNKCFTKSILVFWYFYSFPQYPFPQIPLFLLFNPPHPSPSRYVSKSSSSRNISHSNISPFLFASHLKSLEPLGPTTAGCSCQGFWLLCKPPCVHDLCPQLFNKFLQNRSYASSVLYPPTTPSAVLNKCLWMNSLHCNKP